VINPDAYGDGSDGDLSVPVGTTFYLKPRPRQHAYLR